jgi:hypothetical protein
VSEKRRENGPLEETEKLAASKDLQTGGRKRKCVTVFAGAICGV